LCVCVGGVATISILRWVYLTPEKGRVGFGTYFWDSIPY
jgi:hypothetical protein